MRGAGHGEFAATRRVRGGVTDGTAHLTGAQSDPYRAERAAGAGDQVTARRRVARRCRPCAAAALEHREALAGREAPR